MQNLHFFCKVPVLLAKTGRFRCIRLLPPPGFSRAERFDLKPPGLQLRAGDTRLPGNAALCRARFIKPLNRCCLILVRILPSMVSRLVPLSWTGVRYPAVRKQGRSSQVATCRGIRTRPSGTGAVAGIRRPVFAVFVRTGAARRHVLPCDFGRPRSFRHSRAVLRIFRRKGPRRERGPGPLVLHPPDIARPGFDRVPGHNPGDGASERPAPGSGLFPFALFPKSLRRSRYLPTGRRGMPGSRS